MSKPTLTKNQSYWLNHIQQCEQQNLTAPIYCDQHDLKISQLYSYKYELRRKGFLQTESSTTAFAKARISTPQSPITARAKPATLSLSFSWGKFRLQMTTGGPLL